MIHYELHFVHEILGYLKGQERRHYKDVKDKALFPHINMDWDMYEELSKKGLCVAVLAKDGNKIIGYSCYTLATDMNNKDETVAQSAAFFVERKYRGKLVVEFIKECDKILEGINVSKVLHTHSDVRIGKILERAGFQPKSINWIKTL